MLRGQPPAVVPTAAPEDTVEAYLERLGMTRLIAEQLNDRLGRAEGDERKAIAERLGRLYVALLTEAATADDRARWEQRGRELLAAVPEADTGELRLNLAKAVYIRVEEVVERGRLRLAEPAEMRESERQLRALEPDLTSIARRAGARVEELERAENAGNSSDELATAISEARRLRSLAFYYAGWCHYYLAYLGNAEPEAVEAMKCFGWLLNSSGGRLASVDRLPTDLLRYEHISRAAIGAALSASLRGNDVEAIRWLDSISEAPDVPEVIKDQMLVRRIIVLGHAKRWADLEQLVRRARRGEKLHGYGGGPGVHEPRPLPINAARLLAVTALEADRTIAGQQVESLARTALGDLVARQEIAQVLDLVRRYGTAPIGDSGFIVHYVRGLVQYDRAREAHKKDGDSGEEPSSNPEVASLYRAAADMLQAAVGQPDAETFRIDRAKAGVMMGRCFFYSGDPRQAGERFATAWEAAGKVAGGEAAEEALWLSVLAFDRAARAGGEGAAAAEARRAEVGTLFLATYPESPRAARVVLLQSAAGEAVGEDDALRILSEVPKNSPVYETARRQVARLLYNKFRNSRGQDRELAALRFIAVAEELLAADRKLAMEGPAAEARAACERMVTRVRQMLDALLGGTSPDPVRASAVLEVFTGVAKFNGLDLRPFDAEITYRRLQIALAREQEPEAVTLGERLAELASDSAGATQFAAAADRLIYKRLASRWRTAASGADGPSPEESARLVRFGHRVIDRLGSDPAAMQDASILTLYSTVAAAATRLADGGDARARESAISLDQAVLAAAPRSEEPLRRLAHNAELANRAELAIDCWRTLFGAASQGSPVWFEARFHSLRLLRADNPAKVRELLDQLKKLYPDFGPEPWSEKFRELDAELASVPPAAPGPAVPPASPPSPASSGGGGGP